MRDDLQTCARPSYRSGQKPYTVVVVDNNNDHRTYCKVNDRGPAEYTARVIDLSPATIKSLKDGHDLIPVRIYKELRVQ